MTADIDRIIAEKLMGWKKDSNGDWYDIINMAMPTPFIPSTNAENCIMAMEAMRERTEFKVEFIIGTVGVQWSVGILMPSDIGAIEIPFVRDPSFTLAVSTAIAAALTEEE